MAGNRKPGTTGSTAGDVPECDLFCLRPGPVGIRAPSLVGPLRLDLPTPPQLPQPSGPQQARTPPPPPQPAPPIVPPPPPPPPPTASLREKVNAMLDRANFDIPLVADNKRAFFNNYLISLDQITDIIFEDLHQGSPDLKRADVWSEVWQAYQRKIVEHEQSHWQWVFQVLYTPQYTLWATQPPPSPWMNSLQVAIGRNYRAHWYGQPGFEHTLQLNGSFFNLGADNLDWFQNVLLSYQLSYTSPLGREFRLFGVPDWWAYLQGSVFGQVAAGMGANWDQNAAGARTAYLGLLVQATGGGQLSLNIGWLQILLQGAAVYSWLSPTVQPHSRAMGSFGGQAGLGLGAQF
jgi:hypothetical protein